MTRKPHISLAERLNQGTPTYGGWLVENSDSAIEAYIDAGFEYVGIDCQHSILDESDVAKILLRQRNASCAFLTRCSGNDPSLIGKLLDAGSDGVIVPGVNTVEEARAAVDACRYPPFGKRSFGPIRSGLGTTPREIEQRAMCLLMIETKEGLDNVEEICRVPGVSGIYIGPTDLSIGLELDPSKVFSTDILAEPYARIRAACEANKLVLGSHALSADQARRFVDWGCRYVTIGTNVMLFAQAARAAYPN